MAWYKKGEDPFTYSNTNVFSDAKWADTTSCRIYSNTLRIYGIAEIQPYFLTLVGVNQYTQVEYNDAEASQPQAGNIWRLTDKSNYYRCQKQSSGGPLQVYKVVGGSQYTVGSHNYIGGNATGTYRTEMVGQDIAITWDGGTYTRSDASLSPESSYTGIEGYNPGTYETYFENFECGDDQAPAGGNSYYYMQNQ